MEKHKDPQNPITIRDLYPHLTEEQLQEAEENLDAYIEAVLRIYERIRSDPEKYAEFRKLIEERKHKKG